MFKVDAMMLVTTVTAYRVERFYQLCSHFSQRLAKKHGSRTLTVNNTAQPERQCPSCLIHVASHDDVSPVGNSVLMRGFPKYTNKHEPNVLKMYGAK